MEEVTTFTRNLLDTKGEIDNCVFNFNKGYLKYPDLVLVHFHKASQYNKHYIIFKTQIDFNLLLIIFIQVY